MGIRKTVRQLITIIHVFVICYASNNQIPIFGSEAEIILENGVSKSKYITVKFREPVFNNHFSTEVRFYRDDIVQDNNRNYLQTYDLKLIYPYLIPYHKIQYVLFPVPSIL